MKAEIDKTDNFLEKDLSYNFSQILRKIDEVGYEKPSTLIYLSIINKMKLSPENIIMIGDNYQHDIVPSLDLGLITFHFKNNDKQIYQVINNRHIYLVNQ